MALLRAWVTAASLVAATSVAPGVEVSPSDAIRQDDACAPVDLVLSGRQPACGMGLLQQDRSRTSRHDQVQVSADSLYQGGGLVELPTTMLACRRSLLGAYPLEAVPMPSPSAGQALVKVAGSSLNPLDRKIPLPGPVGRDFAGTVVRVAEGCRFAVGDSVWGDAQGYDSGLGGRPLGAWAEYLAVPCDLPGYRPLGITEIEAGAMPHAALAGLQALHVAGAPWSSSPAVLVLGGAGGVGHMAIQMAKALGAGKVIVTCSERNFDFVTSLGADQAIDYHTSDWWTILGEGSVDVVLDAVGKPGTGNHAFDILRDGGSFVTLLGGLAMATKSRPNVSQAMSSVHETGPAFLDTLKGWVDEGKLKVTIASKFTLEEIAQAVELSEGGHVDGKIAIEIAA